MKTTVRSLLLLCLAAVLTLSLIACSSSKLDDELEIKISVLNGTTGFGAAKLMNKGRRVVDENC